MKNLIKASLVLSVAVAGMSSLTKAQTVAVNGIGSSGIFLELGLGASSSSGQVKATCVWSENTNTVIATDGSKNGNGATDKGSAWVAWTPGSGGSCTAPVSPTIYAYLQTDSVVGDRCLFNGCTVAYPTGNPAPAGLILGSSEVALPTVISTALNSHATVTAAGTDIRPEDAEFAITRTTTPCGEPVASGSQYLGLGYNNGDQIKGAVINGAQSTFNVVKFALPTSYTVTPVGVTPVVVVVNGNGDTTGFSNPSIKDISSSTLAMFLDGRYTNTQQVLSSTGNGDSANVIIREPLSGTYNTTEYNVPNTTANQTSQDVGLNQPTADRNCSSGGGGTGVGTNPLALGVRQRAIGTGQELSQVRAITNSLGYSFWSVANFAGFTSSYPNAKYLTVDGVDPLLSTTAPSAARNVIPTSANGNVQYVDLHTTNTASGNYPIWSLLRLVNIGSSNSSVQALATAAQAFVNFGTTTSRPDFITAGNSTTNGNLKVVRSHFLPPAVTLNGTIANGHVSLVSSACTSPELGGDVGGVVYTLTADSSYCSTNKVTTGHTGQRR